MVKKILVMIYPDNSEIKTSYHYIDIPDGFEDYDDDSQHEIVQDYVITNLIYRDREGKDWTFEWGIQEVENHLTKEG